jgi:hypothetical protein
MWYIRRENIGSEERLLHLEQFTTEDMDFTIKPKLPDF